MKILCLCLHFIAHARPTVWQKKKNKTEERMYVCPRVCAYHVKMIDPLFPADFKPPVLALSSHIH